VITTKTRHFDSEGIGFILETPKYSIGYTSDTEYTQEIAEQYKNCGLLILNCKYPGDEAKPGHLCSVDAAKFLNTAQPKLGVITHFGIKMIEADPIYEAREIQKQAGVEVVAAKDGLMINPNSFSTRMKQVKLDTFKE